MEKAQVLKDAVAAIEEKLRAHMREEGLREDVPTLTQKIFISRGNVTE